MPRYTIPTAPRKPKGAPPFHIPCKATIDHVTAPCPNYAGAMSNYVCERCETRIVGAMHGALVRYGKYDFSQELKKAFDGRAWSPYSLRMEVTK